MSKENLLKFEEDKIVEQEAFSAWYLKSLQDAEFFDYSPVKGCMVIRPNGYALWEEIKNELNSKIKLSGAKNAYFPVFIPESFIKKEKKHVDGFSPELAVVTHAGGQDLEENLVIRPTSETMIYFMFEKWIKSYRDLPLKINQWANVVHWEKRTKPFSRTSEFLWQEGHTAHETKNEAESCAKDFLKLYKDFFKEHLAIPLLSGKKTETEKFAGAETTYTIEAMMRDGKALQVGTSHLLSESFPKSFGIKFQDKEGRVTSPWCTSWGTSTRMIAAISMVHGDENGLVLPPKVAPVQVGIVPIFKKEIEPELKQFLDKITDKLSSLKIRFDVIKNSELSVGARFFKCEKMGIPFRIEVGKRDIESNSVVFVRRVSKEGKKIIKLDELETFLPAELEDFQSFLYKRAESFLKKNIKFSETFENLKEALKVENSFFEVFWCSSLDCEKKLKEINSSIRVILEDSISAEQCFSCKAQASCKVIVSKAY